MGLKHCTVLGAGIAGLTLADKLSDRGIRVTVLEKEAFVGGLARRVAFDGGAVDFGPHNLRAGNPLVLNYWRNLLGADLEIRQFRPQIYFRGSLLSYPIKPVELLGKLAPATLLRCGAGLLLARSGLSAESRRKETFGDSLKASYGRPLHDEFFKPFTEKIWGRSPDQLDAALGSQRIPRPSLIQLAFGRLGWKQTAHSEDPGAFQHYYPKHGVFQLCDAIMSRLKQKGVVVQTATSLAALTESEDGLAVTTQTGARLETWRTDYLASTGSLPGFLGILGLPTDHVASSLQHRGLSILFLSVPRGVRMPEAFTYCADASLPFNRITDFLHCSEHVCPPGKNIIAVEFPTRDDTPAEAAMDQVLAAIRRTNLLDLSVLHARQLEHASVVYPVYQTGYARHLRAALELSAQRPRMLTLGRHGTFAHVNIDRVMEQAFAASDLLLTDPFSAKGKADFYFGS